MEAGREALPVPYRSAEAALSAALTIRALRRGAEPERPDCQSVRKLLMAHPAQQACASSPDATDSAATFGSALTASGAMARGSSAPVAYKSARLEHPLGVFLDLLEDLEFLAKVAAACTLFHQGLCLVFGDRQFTFLTMVIIYWLAGSVSFSVFAWLIERVLKVDNAAAAQRLSVRVKPVKKQQYPTPTFQGVCKGEMKAILSSSIILYLAPEVQRSSSATASFGWFVMWMVSADFCFYCAHARLHTKRYRSLHAKHHEYSDTCSQVAGHKSLPEYVLTSITDLLPIFILGFDFKQLLAWTVIGNMYNLEGHSALSLFFIGSNFHDLHHTCYTGNYGIIGFWDRVFGTFNPPTRRAGIFFPVGSLESFLLTRK